MKDSYVCTNQSIKRYTANMDSITFLAFDLRQRETENK